MCGICGIYNFNPEDQVDRFVLAAMNRQIAHRGPDDDGFYVYGNVGLAMRRLSIVDLQTGQQPVTNEDKSVWLVYNGEIYNHSELRAKLIALNHNFRSRSDTETIVHLYEEYKSDCVKHLRGMFAFALWDARRKVLLVARDRLGIKPIYYRLTRDNFLFGSEIKAILAHPAVQPEFNRAGLPEYLAFGYLAGPQTLFRGIQKLPPGHILEMDVTGKVSIREYWDLTPSGDALQSKKECAHTYREMLEQAVESHLMSDVPVGMFLSGGLDSSAIAALMTKIRQRPIETFAVGYEEEAFSELRYARAVSRHIGSNHHEVRVNFRQFFDTLPKLIWHEDEPLVWPSSVSLYFVALLAREYVKVVLTGEGSDETLAGYTRYAWTLWNARFDRAYRQLMPRAFRDFIREAIADSSWATAGLRRKLQHSFLGRNGASWESFYFDNFYSAFSESLQDELLKDVTARDGGAVYADSLAFWEKSSGRSVLQRLLYTDIKTYLVELLMKQDNMSMAASIESRVPFLDHPLVEYAISIPGRFNVHGMSGKGILKLAVEDLLPREIVYRKKMGFPTPWRGWLGGIHLSDIEALLMEPRSLDRGLFRPESVKQLFTAHRNRLHDHGDRIWRLLNLELWHRIFVDGESAAALTCRDAATAQR